ncbi:hypothetical protein AYI69_g10788 [Smittium culicis]|uniref:Uncharacterized protein n=1 Tax=Smittium culicis TaxID=133412 RepID=A0A1R1X3G4_9FUNG|nr:hypothetical protein AYI69_g10788 [Smittium culicis]
MKLKFRLPQSTATRRHQIFARDGAVAEGGPNSDHDRFPGKGEPCGVPGSLEKTHGQQVGQEHCVKGGPDHIQGLESENKGLLEVSKRLWSFGEEAAMQLISGEAEAIDTKNSAQKGDNLARDDPQGPAFQNQGPQMRNHKNNEVRDGEF